MSENTPTGRKMEYMETGRPSGSAVGAARMSMEDQGSGDEREGNGMGNRWSVYGGDMPLGPMETAAAEFGRFSTPPPGSTGRQQGQPYSAPPQAAASRKYRMESDIFGTGFGPSSQASGSRYGMKIDRTELGEPRRAVVEPDTPAGMPSLLKVGGSPSSEDGAAFDDRSVGPGTRRVSNARETGGNPLTGEGYGDDSTHSQRRQFRSSKSTPLW